MKKLIDTVRFRIKLREKYKGDLLMTLEQKKLGKLEWKTYKDYFNLPSSSYNINIYITHNDYCFLEFSLPKLMNGHNLVNGDLNDLVRNCVLIEKYLESLGVGVGSFHNWEVMRIDLSENKYCEDIEDELRMYQSADYPRKRKYVYDTSVMFVGRTYSIKIYNKQEEFYRNDYKKVLSSEGKSFLLGASQNLLRFEVSYRSQSLKNITRQEKLCLKGLLEFFPEVQSHYNLCLKNTSFRIRKEIRNNNDILKILLATYSNAKALQLYQFYVLYSKDEFNKKVLKDFYSRSSFYRRKRDLKLLNII